MFSCFGSKNKKVKIKSEIKKNYTNNNQKENLELIEEKKLEHEIKDLEIEKDNLNLGNKITDKENEFLNELIEDFTITLNSMNNINEKNEIFENTLKDFLNRENTLLENKLNSINIDDNNTRTQYNNISDEIFKLNNTKYKNNQFILENQLIEKQNELNFLILKLDKLKNRKKNQNEILIDDIFLNNNVLEKQKTKLDSSESENEEKENSNIDYHQIEKKEEKKNISRDEEKTLKQKEKGDLDENNNELIRKIYSDNIQYSRNIYRNIYNQAKNENIKYSSQKKKLYEIKEEIENIKNPKKSVNNDNNEKIAELENNKEEDNEKIIKEKNELIQKNKSLIENLIKKVEEAKNSKKEIQNEINNLYNVLNEKLKENQELEKKLKIVKDKKTK